MGSETRSRGHSQRSGRPSQAGAAEHDVVPSRRQYLELKAQHPEAILLYRMGDFYETFDEDAKVVARDARITLTSRSFGRSGRVPMAGIPHHALNHYLSRLLQSGHTLAIAEQLSEPGKGLVERAVTRVVTPGTIAEAGLLPGGENQYLAAIAFDGSAAGLAWADVSTGEFRLAQYEGDAARERLAQELTRLNPAECLISDRYPDGLDATGWDGGRHRTRLDAWHFEPARGRERLRRHFDATSLTAFGCDGLSSALGAAGAILVYLERNNPRLLPLLSNLRVQPPDGYVMLDAATRRNLELTHSLRSSGSRGSLLATLDLTVTPMGSRSLRRLLGQPLCDLARLQRRQALVAALVEEPRCRAGLRRELGAIGDLERLAGRVAQGSAGVRDFLALRQATAALPSVQARLRATGAVTLGELAERLGGLADLTDALSGAVDEDAATGARLRRGFAPELDAAVDASRRTRDWLAQLERSERERTGIRSLKVGFNKVFGYYIEVSRANLGLVPGEYSRKQTVANGERFVTTELKEAESRILAADDEIALLERAALDRLAGMVRGRLAALLAVAERLARLDAYLALADVAARERWTRPTLDQSEQLEIEGGRHPVVEASLGGVPFIANDCRLGGAHPRHYVLTGPNMGGKSTYLRQVALTVLLAQVGSFVPAERARIGLVDRIFTRIGAQDDLAGGSSTFMVEMVETAVILRQATSRSLVILDEVGRGTSARDGLAIARAVFEDLHRRIHARTLFATHYLELAAVAAAMPDAANLQLAATEAAGRVIFLYDVQPGVADQAYGIHVARLAGLPPHVTERADAILRQGDEAPGSLPERRGFTAAEVRREGYQLSLEGLPAGEPVEQRCLRELRQLDLATMTPGEVIDWVLAQQSRLHGAQRDLFR